MANFPQSGIMEILEEWILRCLCFIDTKIVWVGIFSHLTLLQPAYNNCNETRWALVVMTSSTFVLSPLLCRLDAQTSDLETMLIYASPIGGNLC